jgi:hypothetical protein
MKNKIFSVLLLLILVFLVANKINVKAYESFVGAVTAIKVANTTLFIIKPSLFY